MRNGKRATQILDALLTSCSAACLFLAVGPAFGAEGAGLSSSPPTMAPAGQSASAPETAAGMIIYIDPKTGAILKGPAPGSVPLQLAPQSQNGLSTSGAGLVQVPNPVPGGGVKIDLQGRFQSPLIATVDANGTLRIDHPAEAEQPQ